MREAGGDVKEVRD